MAEITLTLTVPDGGCSGCQFHRVVQVIEVGMSPDEDWCSLFNEELSYRLEPCEKCVRARKTKAPKKHCDHFWQEHMGSYELRTEDRCMIKCKKCGKTEMVVEDGLGRTIWPRGYRH